MLGSVWFGLTASGALAERTLASPAQVWQAASVLIENGQLQANLQASVVRAMTGLVLGVLIGTTLAVLAGLWRLADNLIDAPMQMLRAMPILALIPLAIVWFGIGEEVKIILVALGVTFPMYLNTHAAIRGVDQRYMDLAQTVGLGRARVIRWVIAPAALPGFFTGLRFAVAISWLVLVVAEQINASSGIGFLMTRARSFSDTDTIMVGLIVYALLGLVSDFLVRLLERRALRWRSTLQAS